MTKVKICGLRTPEDVRKVSGLLPEYVGFIFAEGSRRQVSAGEAEQMKRLLPQGIQAVGVFVNQEIPVIAALVRDGIIDCVQLHGHEDEEYICKLKSLVKSTVIKSVSIGSAAPSLIPTGADYLLLDTASPQHGGAGKTFDWALAAGIKPPFFLAGGLSESNVKDAISTLRPYCVDVSSGVETNGVKDDEKIRRFIRLVRNGV